MPSPDNRAIVAAAGSGKTATVIDHALAATGRVLVVTFTNENQRQILRRIERAAGGHVPDNITVMGWFSFLINEVVRPYQSFATGTAGRVRDLNFVGSRHKFAKRENLNYYLDKHDDLFRDGVADLACRIDGWSEGRTIRRLERIYSHIFVDEFQDLVGYDLDFVERLLRSKVKVTLVGDPRQHTFSTNLSPRNKKYRGAGFVAWLVERDDICEIEIRCESHRCNQELCDFADALFPDLPATVALNVEDVPHRGVFVISRDEVTDYVERWKPVVLRESKRHDTCGLPAMNIGVAKGSTFDRVLIFPGKPALAYVKTRELTKLKSHDRLYVAVTRARHSATFVE